MKKARWLWQLTGSHAPMHGYVEAYYPRDALSRALTSKTATGRLLGEEKSIPIDVLYGAPGNADISYEVTDEEFSLRVSKVVCPTKTRHANDVIGCGSTSVSGPDEEGLFDCQDCGIFFQPTAE